MDDVRELPARHVCRVDDLAYESVGAWYTDHRGRVPIQAAHALTREMQTRGCTFAEAFTALVDRGAIILIE